MEKLFAREVAALGLPAAPASTAPVTEAELAPLPAAARRYLEFMRVVGRPRDWSIRARWRVRFRAGPTARWHDVIALQYSSGWPEVARLFYMRLPFFGVPVMGRDTYVRGVGRMLIRPLDLFTVQDGRGPEFDLGELVTWLNDAVLFAPSMLLVPATTWRPVDDGAFDLVFQDRGHAVTARVLVDARGAPRDFRTEDRWYAPPGAKGPLVRTPWSTPVAGYRELDGRMLPTSGHARWLFPDGTELPYAEFGFGPGDLAVNVPPPR